MASEGDKYICDGVWLRCDKGAAPGLLTVLPKTVQLYGKSWATQLDAVPLVNIPSFGGCLVSNSLCAPLTTHWTDVMETVSVLGQKPLLDRSTCQCMVGGTIHIFFSQQAALAAGPAPLSAADAAAEQQDKEDAHFWGNVGKGLLIAAAVVGAAVVIAGTGGAALAVLGAAAATGAAVGGVGGAVAGGISGGPQGAIAGFFQGAAYGALGGVAVASGAGVVAGGLAIGAAGAGVASLGFLGKAYYHNPSRENGLVLVGAVAGMAASLVAGAGIRQVKVSNMRFGKFADDPARDYYGSGRESHPVEWQTILDHLKEEGVEIRYRKNALAYGLSNNGKPGQLILDEDASYSALKHEYQHYLDDKANNFPGGRVYYDPSNGIRKQMETNAYDVEIEMARKQGNTDLATELGRLKQQEHNRIDGGL